MRFPEWEVIYEQILEDMGYDRVSDENAAKLLKAITLNSNIIDEDEVIIEKDVTIFGNSPDLESNVSKTSPQGTLIASGSSAKRLLEMNIIPEIVVTDLDGDIASQIECSRNGAITFIHAHGDNTESIQRYVSEFKGPIILTTQSTPDGIMVNYGGFTDGDRAVCIARHFGAKRILLLGFDFEDPTEKENMDPKIKLRKLQWAKRIIFDHNEEGIEIKIPN